MFRRLLALIRKELQIVFGEKRTRMMLITPVILQTVLFPFAATMEVRNATLAVLDRDGGRASTEVVHRLSRTAAFSTLLHVHSDKELREVIDAQKALLAVSFPPDFSRKLLSGQVSPMLTVIDGRRSNSGQIAGAYASEVIDGYTRELGGRPASTLEIRSAYNPNLHSQWHVLPSLVAIITTIGCLFVTALSVAREREEGTFEQLLVSPFTPAYLMVGKAIPGILVAFCQGLFIALAAIVAFGLPFTGSFLVMVTGILFYGMALAGIGLAISSISMTQQQAFFGIFTFMTPAVLLSGYVSPIENMPRVLQWLAQADPLSHMVFTMKGVFLKGFGFADAWPHLWPMLAIAFCTLSMALAMFRRHIV
jgi:ABC-2 type transport system permease protein